MGTKKNASRYHQFCPVAAASEIFAERWTPLVVRELLCGTRRFNDLRRGLPRMSQSLLSRRLKELEDAGLVHRRPSSERQRGWEYGLTEAGLALRPIVEQLGAWGHRWVQQQVTADDLNAKLLMWDLQRRLATDRMPQGPLVIHFHYPDAEQGYRRFWVIWEGGEVDICLKNPGRPVDIELTADLRTMTLVWLGDLSFREALGSGRLKLEGDARLRRAFPDWLGLSLFAGQKRAGGPLPAGERGRRRAG